jgi:NADH dehydrogenase
MSKPVCAVTGASGFVGAALMRRLSALGFNVIPLLRKPNAAYPNARYFTLGEPVSQKLFEGIDVLIHAAYDFSVCGWADICRVNVVGSEYLFDAARRAGGTKQIFISSLAAFEGCRSDYGLGKLAAEEAARIRSGIVIRPGVIYSIENGGIAEKIARLARSLPVLPMIGSGDYPLYTCHVDDLCELVTNCIQNEVPPGTPLIAANPQPVTLRKLAQSARTDDTKPFIVPIPWRLVFIGLWLLERMGLRPGFRSDSVMSLVHANQAVDFTSPLNPAPFFRSF